jgi:hypothetical protein
MATGKEAMIDDVVKNIGKPDYPFMLLHADSVPMPDENM